MKLTPTGAVLLCVAFWVAAPALANDLIAIAATARGAPPPEVTFSLVFDKFWAAPVWGVPVTVFGAAATGAGISLFFRDPLPARQMWGQVLAACIFGVASATLVADAFDLKWATSHPALFALLAAGILRWFLPTAIERGKAIIREFRISFWRGKADNQKGGEP